MQGITANGRLVVRELVYEEVTNSTCVRSLLALLMQKEGVPAGTVVYAKVAAASSVAFLSATSLILRFIMLAVSVSRVKPKVRCVPAEACVSL